MRAMTLIIGGAAIAACSVDHLRVAALDPAAGGRAAGESGASAGLNAGANGSLRPNEAAGGDDSSLNDGGGAASKSSPDLTGAAGLSSRVFCACLSHESHYCGSDGITYPVACEDGGTCQPPAVGCWHACPCLDNEPDGGAMTSLFPSDCPPTTQCSGDMSCWLLSSAEAEQQPPCTPAGN